MEALQNIILFLPEILKAAPLSLLLTFLAAIFGLMIGTLVALARISNHAFIAKPAFVFTFIFRGTPLLVQLYLIYYGLGEILPSTPLRQSFLWPYLRDGLWYAIIALSFNQAAYNAEVIRGAILSIPKGQIEAAQAIGMRPNKIFKRITLPLAFHNCLPILISDIIILFKSTSLASTITIMEILGTTRMIQRQSLLIFEPLIAAGIIYFTVVLIFTSVMKRVENKTSQFRNQLR